MPYFPLSQIKPNLYTNGGELIIATTKEDYKGYYYETSNGKKYTGSTPQDGPNVLLLPSKISTDTPKSFSFDSPNNIILNTTEDYTDKTSGKFYSMPDPDSYPKNIDFKSRNLPQPSQNLLIDNPEQSIRFYTRYFCKKNNELKYMEIDKPTFDKLSSRSQDIAWDLYTPVSILWYVGSSGINKGLVSQIEREQKWYGFTQWFKDKFY
jgi:hypothetical protein